MVCTDFRLGAVGYQTSVPSGISWTNPSRITNETAGQFASISSSGFSANDFNVHLQKNLVIVGSNLAKTDNYPSSFETAEYGSSDNLWGTTWTPADINSANFGVAMRPSLFLAFGNFLRARDFGFQIPDEATITGIRVEINRRRVPNQFPEPLGSQIHVNWIKVSVCYTLPDDPLRPLSQSRQSIATSTIRSSTRVLVVVSQVVSPSANN